MMHLEYVLRESELIKNESGCATSMAIGYGLIDLGLTLFGVFCGQGMKTLSLVYRWCWGGIC